MNQIPQGQTSTNLTVVDRYLPDHFWQPDPYGPIPVLRLNTIRAILWRQRYVILGIVSLVMALGLAVTMMMTPLYDATATLRVNNKSGEIIEGGQLDPYISAIEVSTYLNTLSEVITSRSMALAVVDDLELSKAPSKAEDISVPDEVRRQELAAELSANLEVQIPGDSRILAITYRSDDPEEAARLANAFANSFLRDNLMQGIEMNAYAKEYLDEQIGQTREKLQTAEQKAVDYARANRIIGPALLGGGSEGTESSGTAPTITMSNLASANSALSAARERRIAAEQRWRAVASVPAAQLPEVRQSSMIQSLRTELAEATARKSSLSQRYQSDYPELREMSARIDDLGREISAASEEIKRSIRDEYQIALRQEGALRGEVNAVSSRTLDEQDRRLEYNLLERDAAAIRTQLDTLLQRYNEISAASNIRSSDVTQLDMALPPTVPSSPNLFKNLAAALIIGLGLAAVAAVLREAFDDRLRSAEDVERKLGARAIGQTPHVGHEVMPQIADFSSPISEAYSSIRASLDYQLPNVECPAVQFTSSQPSEGKSTSALATARKYASIGRKVLLIDMDLRRPSILASLELEKPSAGLLEALFMHIPLDEAILADVESNLDVLPVAAVPENPAEVLSSGLVAELLAKCRESYDVIIIDSSPVMGIADAPLLSRFVDAVVFVVEANKAQAGQARAAITRLRDMHANILGVVLTKFRAMQAGEAYDHQYRYYSYASETGSEILRGAD